MSLTDGERDTLVSLQIEKSKNILDKLISQNRADGYDKDLSDIIERANCIADARRCASI